MLSKGQLFDFLGEGRGGVRSTNLLLFVSRGASAIWNVVYENKGDELSKSSVVQYRYKVQKEGGSSDKF